MQMKKYICNKTTELNPVVGYLVDSPGIQFHSKIALVAKLSLEFYHSFSNSKAFKVSLKSLI